MKILVTGSNGFVGKNLVETLKTIRDGKKQDTSLYIEEVFEFDVSTDEELLREYCEDCDFVFHLAGVNRPKDESEFGHVNRGLTERVLKLLKAHNHNCPVMLASSIQAAQTGRFADSLYGKSKSEAEQLVFDYGLESDTKVYVFRFPNLFGKWCRPNYNSVIATFCNAFANHLPYQVSDRETKIEFLYIDDLVNEMLNILSGKTHRCEYKETQVIPKTDGMFCYVPVTHTSSLGNILDLLESFDKQQETLMFHDIPDGSFEKKLYSTYLSYLPTERMIFDLHSAEDHRGAFTEFFKTKSSGQFSVNVSKPGIVRGEHWHHTKMEIFLVVSGRALIQERQIGTDENGNPYPIREFKVSGDRLQCVYMLPGYTHNIINLSDTDELITVMWANEVFDEKHPETYRETVEETGMRA